MTLQHRDLVGRARVLFVDDDPAVIRSLGGMLVRRGYDVAVAEGGRAAIDQAYVRTFDVVVTDVCMPQVDGLSLLRSIRAHDAEIPVILLTGRPTLETAAEAMEHGAFGYLLKPVTPSTLLANIERAVRWRRVAQLRKEATEQLQRVAAADRGGLQTRFLAAIDSLWIAMQPIVSWRDRAVFAYEALVRTDEPTLRSAADLFSAAHSLGRTDQLGHRIRRLVGQALSHSPPGLQVFVNLLPGDLGDPELVSPAGALTPFASQIVLEVTQRATLDDTSELPVRIQRLRDLGFRIALDDLGAGYAGLVKIDMSLIRHIDRSAVKQKLFCLVASLCCELSMQLIAEGVETADERDCVLSLGGQPVPGQPVRQAGAWVPGAEPMRSANRAQSPPESTHIPPADRRRSSGPRHHP